jgi:hypothetical protein
MIIAYRISEADYMDAHDLFAANEKPWYRRLSRRVLPWAGAFVVAMDALYLIVVRHPDTVFVPLAGVTGFFFIYLGFAMRLYFRKSYRNDQRYKHDLTAEISDEGIDIAHLFANSQMKWNSFVRVLESDSIFMVFIAPWLFLVFPKRFFSPEQADQFRVLLRRYVPSSE